MNKHISMFSIGLMMTGAYTTSLAQPPVPPNFASMDKDGDGRVNEQEFQAFRAERMAQRAAEGRPMRNAASAPNFAEIDADGDSYLSKDEFKAHAKMMRQSRKGAGMKKNCARPNFSKLDANGDGTIQRTEFDEFYVTSTAKVQPPVVAATPNATNVVSTPQSDTVKANASAVPATANSLPPPAPSNSK